jgi:acetyl-CoA/propionyl-CoA carboxylase biotin carboxyl carrier protein
MKVVLDRGDREIAAEVVPHGAGYAVALNGRRLLVEGAIGPSMRVLVDHRPVEATARRDGASVIVEIRGRAYRFRVRDARAPKLARRGGGADLARGELHAPMPGMVVEVLAHVGDQVVAGAPLVVVEAMKMQNAFVAPVTGRVASVAVRPGTAVESGQLLVAVTPEEA